MTMQSHSIDKARPVFSLVHLHVAVSSLLPVWSPLLHDGIDSYLPSCSREMQPVQNHSRGPPAPVLPRARFNHDGSPEPSVPPSRSQAQNGSETTMRVHRKLP